MRRHVLLTTLITLAFGMHAAWALQLPQPKAYGDFDHYTLALTWQPGFCADGSCASSQDHAVDIGLHGLWPSRPQNLIDRGVAAPQWWSRGCNYYHHSDAAPMLDQQTRTELQHIMPQLSSNLLQHEYDKHVQCFGYDPQTFFDTALALRGRIAGSAFGDWLRHHAGQTIAGADLHQAFDRTFSTRKTSALQLRCSSHDGRQYLSQMWFTIPRQKLGEFPQDAGLANTPIAQHNCAAHFQLLAW